MIGQALWEAYSHRVHEEKLECWEYLHVWLITSCDT